MEKEIKYPIKYAVLELKERGGWSEGYNDITQGFIVSKCYVVGTNIIYNSDGSNRITHKVVFPYSDISTFKTSISFGRSNIGQEDSPSYDACDRPYPVRRVNNLYDTYEEAKKEAIELNDEHKSSLTLFISVLDPNWKEEYKRINEQFDKKLKQCYFFEELIQAKTKDMIVSEEDFENVRVLKPSSKIINC